MKRVPLLIVILLVLLVGLVFFLVTDEKKGSSQGGNNSIQVNQIISNNMKPLTLTSSAFSENGNISSKYTCDGDQMIPPLSISGVPDETKSLALIVHDPDAPVSGGFTHWTVWNIDPAMSDILEGQAPSGATEGVNGSGKNGYTGPCPPSGIHHYQFILYALDTKLNLLPASAGKAELEQAMQGHILEQTMLVGLYQRI